MSIREVTQTDFQEWLELAHQLWPDYDSEDVRDALTALRQSSLEAAYLARNQAKLAVGFINLSLRYDPIPGATQKPVAYVEGIYVRPEFREQGYGTALMQQAEVWARHQGCAELASDVTKDNRESQAFHRHVGFDESDRVVSFIKSV